MLAVVRGSRAGRPAGHPLRVGDRRVLAAAHPRRRHGPRVLDRRARHRRLVHLRDPTASTTSPSGTSRSRRCASSTARSCTSRCSSSRSGSTRCCRSERTGGRRPGRRTEGHRRALEFLVETAQAHVVVDGESFRRRPRPSVSVRAGVLHLRVGEAFLLDGCDLLGLLALLFPPPRLRHGGHGCRGAGVGVLFMLLPSFWFGWGHADSSRLPPSPSPSPLETPVCQTGAVDASGEPARVVGRDRELAVINGLPTARRREAQTVVIAGDPGVGKTAVARACADRDGSSTVLSARACR